MRFEELGGYNEGGEVGTSDAFSLNNNLFFGHHNDNDNVIKEVGCWSLCNHGGQLWGWWPPGAGGDWWRSPRIEVTFLAFYYGNLIGGNHLPQMSQNLARVGITKKVNIVYISKFIVPTIYF